MSVKNLKKLEANDNESVGHISLQHEGNDKWNITLLCFLYTLQGIPLGLSSAIPVILQNNGASYSDQAEFSIVSYPFSTKLLWAPIIDAVYSQRFGRRKSWLVPIQYLLGISLFFVSFNIEEWLGDENLNKPPHILLLTVIFFCCCLLAATQDIAVDGWALTILHRKNVGYTSTCNSVGQTTGFFIGYVVSVTLDSAEFSNEWFRTVPHTKGILPISRFFLICSFIYIISTTMVAIFKKEKTMTIFENPNKIGQNIKNSYKLLWRIVKLRSVQRYALILLTFRIGFIASDTISPLKLIEFGASRECITLISVPLIPLQIILPFLLSRFVTGPRPLDIFIKLVPYCIVINLFIVGIVYITPKVIEDDDTLPAWYYALMLVVNGIQQLIMYCMFVTEIAFTAKVSDPSFGATYMTLLNTVSNLGGSIPSTVMLWLMDSLTWKRCEAGRVVNGKICSPPRCRQIVDGFYIEVVLSTLIGIVWIPWGRREIRKLQDLDSYAWMVKSQ